VSRRHRGPDEGAHEKINKGACFRVWEGRPLPRPGAKKVTSPNYTFEHAPRKDTLKQVLRSYSDGGGKGPAEFNDMNLQTSWGAGKKAPLEQFVLRVALGPVLR